MWHLTACKISVSLVCLNWVKNEKIFYRISELMLATLIQRYDKKSFYFKNEILTEILQAVKCHIYDCINTIYQFIKPFLDNKMSNFEEYGAFKHNLIALKQKLYSYMYMANIKYACTSIFDSSSIYFWNVLGTSFKFIWAVTCQNVSFTLVHSDQDLHCSLTESLDTIKCINGE